jgi:hypothetical protein
MEQPLPFIKAASIFGRVVGEHGVPRAVSYSLDRDAGNPFLYPLIGLALERAPFKAYLVILTGPIFILWRIWLSLVTRFGTKRIVWVRTAHKG